MEWKYNVSDTDAANAGLCFSLWCYSNVSDRKLRVTSCFTKQGSYSLPKAQWFCSMFKIQVKTLSCGLQSWTMSKVTFYGWYVFTDYTSFMPYHASSKCKNARSSLLQTIFTPNHSQFSCVKGHYYQIVDCSSITKHFIFQFHIACLHSILISSLCLKKLGQWMLTETDAGLWSCMSTQLLHSTAEGDSEKPSTG